MPLDKSMKSNRNKINLYAGLCAVSFADHVFHRLVLTFGLFSV